MIGIQIISIIFALVFLFFTYSNFRRKDFGVAELIAWSFVWFSFIFVALFPQFFSPYVQYFGFARLMDFVIVIGFFVIFSVLLHNYIVVRRLKRRLETLIRTQALKSLENE